MRHILAILLLLPVAARAQYWDGLPVASAVSPNDIMVVCQGGTPGKPGTCITKQTPVSSIPFNIPNPVFSQGQSTAPLTADQAQLTVGLNNPSLTANQILQDAIGCSGAICANADALRGIATAVSGSTIVNTTGLSGYVLNQNATTGNGQNSVALFGVGISAVNNAETWGVNTVVTDNTSQAVSSGTGRFLLSELDYNVTSPSTQVAGLNLTGAWLAQSAGANGFSVLSPDATGAFRFGWNNGFSCSNGAVASNGSCILIGTAGNPATANQPSARLTMEWTNGSAAAEFYETQVIGGILTTTGGLALPAGSGVAIDNQNMISVNSSADAFIASGSSIPTVVIGNGTASIVMEGPVLLIQKTVATLPACGPLLNGALVEVLDAVSPTYNGALTGGGAVAVPAFCNGTFWLTH